MKSLLPTLKERAQIADYTWISGVSSLLRSILVILSSVQLGLHFWPSSAFISGIRVDYLSPTLLFFDFLLLIALLLPHKTSHPLHSSLKESAPLLFIALTNLLFTTQPLQSFIWWFRLILVYLVSKSLVNHDFNKTRLWIVMWLGVLLVVATIQILIGHSLQGIFYWLGERRIFLGQPGIASQTIFGTSYLRGYSIFPHPNIFAGWALMTLLLPYSHKKASLPSLFHSTLVFLSVIFASSRAALLALIVYVYQQINNRLLSSLLLLVLVISLFFVWQGKDILSVNERLGLVKSSLHQISIKPLFGQGSLYLSGTKSGTITRFQPDHFVPTLLLSWIGVIGTVQLMIWLRPRLIYPLLPLIFFDHYLLTNHSTLFLLMIILVVNGYAPRRDYSKLS